MSKNTVTVYNVGGCGVNIGHKAFNVIPIDQRGVAKINWVFADTTDSNFPKDDTKKDIENVFYYSVPGAEGAGKEKEIAYRCFKPEVNSFLDKYQPGDFNIIVSSMSGGSGNVMAALLLKELLDRDKAVVSIYIGNSTSGKEAGNTRKTYNQLKFMSQNLNKPIVCKFLFNDYKAIGVEGELYRSYVDDQAIATIQSLALLFSGENKEMDVNDIKHFLRYDIHGEEPITPSVIELWAMPGEEYFRGGYGFAVTAQILLYGSREEAENGDMVPNTNPVFSQTSYLSDFTQKTSDISIPTNFYFLTTSALGKYNEHIVSKWQHYNDEAALLEANAKEARGFDESIKVNKDGFML